MKAPKRILIVRTDRLGDVILSTPVIRNLRMAYPKSYIAFMCRPYTKGVLKDNLDLNEVIIYDKYGCERSFWASIKFSFCLRKKKFDWAIILHPTNRAHMVTFFAGIPLRIGWNRKCAFLLNKRVPHLKQEGKKHELEYTLDILRYLNIPIKDKKTYFPISEVAEKRVKDLLAKGGIKNNDKIIVIHPSASCPSKRWPQDSFVELIRLLKQKDDFKIAVITSEVEKEFGQKLVEDRDILDLRGKLDISEVGALLRKCRLFISNDSGPVHIAASFNVWVISIFGRSDRGLCPLRWKPLGDKSFYFHEDAGCKECLAHNCTRDFLCLKKLKAKEVSEKAIAMIDEDKNNE
ncbi:MAG: lipopolysaccharide heptosyltransferase II [Omnitrophica bacterium]|nr:lipopolysaccharide heptosyltransferase II [Candidatus Omnitrophota bacterium]